MPSGPLVAWVNPLPLDLTTGLRDRRRDMAARAAGRVLDLGGWNDHLDSYSGADVDLLVEPGGRNGAGDGQPGVRRLDAGLEMLVDLGVEPYDTVVSLIRTPLVADLPGFLAAVAALLADDGWFLFLEPVKRTDTLGRVLAAWGPVVKATSGLHLDRDIAADVRRCGFEITDLHRFRVPSVAAPLRPFVDGRARLRSPGSSRS
jgi:hypothetical protein